MVTLGGNRKRITNCQICGQEVEFGDRHRVSLYDECPGRARPVLLAREHLTICDECMGKVAAFIDEARERGGLVG